jgi:Protein of unknown function (DUF1566)
MTTRRHQRFATLIAGATLLTAIPLPASARLNPIVDTGQDQCFDNQVRIPCPALGQPFFGQDAQHPKHPASYRDHGDGTITDRVTGLMWAKAPTEPITWAEATAAAKRSHLGGYADWRLPSIKELYSLIDYRGGFTGNPATSKPYINTRVFSFSYARGNGLGDAAQGSRPIDVQEWSSTRYVGKTMGRDDTVFGVNFADGRIKGYPLMDPRAQMTTPNRLKVRLVRGAAYGENDFGVEGEMVADRATGLIWQRADDGKVRTWQEALQYCQALNLDNHNLDNHSLDNHSLNDRRLGNHRHWRLPNAKELQSIVDYHRIPAIASAFQLSQPSAYFWTSTTHLEGPPPASAARRPFSTTGGLAVYIAFGPALGYVEMPPGAGQIQLVDVHGAGAQRSDPKQGDPADFPIGFGPQGDDIRIRNYVRCVNDGDGGRGK